MFMQVPRAHENVPCAASRVSPHQRPTGKSGLDGSKLVLYIGVDRRAWQLGTSGCRNRLEPLA